VSWRPLSEEPPWAAAVVQTLVWSRGSPGLPELRGREASALRMSTAAVGHLLARGPVF
jgi:hypothetical protein